MAYISKLTAVLAAGSRLGLLCVLLLGMHAGPLLAGEDATEKLDVIRRVLSERGEFDLAERQLQSFIQDYRGNPVAAGALALLGYCQDKQKKNNEAAASYLRVLDEYPGAPAPLRADAAIGAADAFYRLGRFADAVKYYTTALDATAKPEQTEAALLWRGEANYRLGIAELDAGGDGEEHLTAAAGDFSAFVERFPTSKNLPSAVAGAGFACYDAGDYARALAYFQRFVKDFPDDRRAEECRFQAAEAMYNMDRFDEAKVAYKELMDANPAGPFAADARGGMAWCDYGLRRVREAAEGFEEAARMAGSDEERRLSFLYNAGCAWREAGDTQKAAAPFQEVAKAKDHELNSLAWFRLGTLWQEQARTARERAEKAANEAERKRYADMQKSLGDDAVQYFRRALSGGGLGREEIEAQSLLGEVLLDAGRYPEAIETFEGIERRWPDTDRAAWAWYHHALAEREISRAAGEAPEGREALRRASEALRKSIEYPQARTRLQATWALADYLATLGDLAAAREQYRWLSGEALQWASAWRNPEGASDANLVATAKTYAADSLFRLGETYYFAPDLPRAAVYYQDLIANHTDSPQSAMAMLRLGEIAEQGKDIPAAMTRYEEALRAGLRFGKAQVGSTIGYAQYRLGVLLVREGQRQQDDAQRRKQLQEALRNLTAVANDHPADLNPGGPLYYLAEAKYALGLRKEALADYEASLKAEPAGDVADAAWLGLAWGRRDTGDAPGAIEACRQLIEKFPDSPLRPDAFVLMASVKRNSGDAAGALADFDDFLEQYPGNNLAAKAELERASALDETGQHREAAEAFQTFLNQHPDHPDMPQALYQRSWALWNLIRPRAEEARQAEARLRDLTGGKEIDQLPEADKVEALKAQDELRGLSAQVKGAEDEILSSLQGLVERYPDYPVVDVAWLRIGEILYDRGDFQRALSAYQRSLALAEARSPGRADKAQYRVAWSIQRMAEAAEQASLREPDPERVEAARKDMWDKRVAAIDAFELILGKFPNSDLVGDAAFRAAELRRRSGQDNTDTAKRSAWLQSAEQRYKQAIERSTPEAPFRRAAEYGQALSMLLDERVNESRDAFQRMLLQYQDGPYVQDAYWGLGQSYLKLGAYADAGAAFEQALALDRATETAAKSRYGLGLTAALAGDKDKARMELQAVDALYSQYPEWAAAALVRAARTALEDGLKDRALGDLERVLARYPNTPAAEEARELQASIAVGVDG